MPPACPPRDKAASGRYRYIMLHPDSSHYFARSFRSAMPTRVPQPYTCRTHHLVPTRRALSPDRSGACPPPLHHAPQHGVSANSNSATRLACGSLSRARPRPCARRDLPGLGGFGWCIVSLPEPQTGKWQGGEWFVVRDHGGAAHSRNIGHAD
jgi:hypothetical protein